MTVREGSGPLGSTILLALGWILLLGGLAILGYDVVRGDGFSLVGAGVAAVGGITAWSESREDAAGSSEGPSDEGNGRDR